jgi:uncharacterized integral membrane protein
MEKFPYLKVGTAVLLLAALLTVILQNRAPVQTRFLFITFEMPQILLLALTALAGLVVGLLLPAFLRRRRQQP